MPAFEEQIHSNVVVAYAMDLLDLVQKVRWDLTKYLIVYKLFIKYLSTCDVGVKCMCSSKNLEGAFWVLQQLKEQGQQPNTITYGLIMEVFTLLLSCFLFFNLYLYLYYLVFYMVLKVMLPCEKYNLVHEFFKKNAEIIYSKFINLQR